MKLVYANVALRSDILQQQRHILSIYFIVMFVSLLFLNNSLSVVQERSIDQQHVIW